MAEKKQKHPGGRPTKYTADVCDAMLKYFRAGNYKTIPFFEIFADNIGTSVSTLHNWKEAHPEFLEAYKKCQEIQRTKLIDGGLSGEFVPSAFIFTAKNVAGMRDQVDHSVDAKIDTTLNIRFV